MNFSWKARALMLLAGVCTSLTGALQLHHVASQVVSTPSVTQLVLMVGSMLLMCCGMVMTGKALGFD
jgi:hypothetical protein